VLEDRNVNITSQFVCTCGEPVESIFKVFEDAIFIQKLKGEMILIKPHQVASL